MYGYVYQSSNIEVIPLAVELDSIIPQIAYTGASQIVAFAKTIKVAGVNVEITALGTLKEGYFGNNDTDTTVNGSEGFTLSNSAVSSGLLSNYTVSLGGNVVIKAGSKAYTFAPHIITKTSSSADISAPVTLNDYSLTIDALTALISGENKEYNLADSAPTTYKLVEIEGITYVFSNDNNLILQLNNAASTLNLYALYDVKQITLASANAEVENEGVYYLFGSYSVGEGEDEKVVAGEAIKAFTGKNLALTVNGENTYYVGYTDLVKLTRKNVENKTDFTLTNEIALLNLGSAFTYAPTRVGYEFVGWAEEDDAITVTGIDTITISATDINSREVTATWEMKAPEVVATQAVTKSANEGNTTITLEDVFGSAELSDIITNYNPTITYSFAWYKGQGAGKSELVKNVESISVKADTDSNGVYTIVVSATGTNLVAEVTFNLTIETVKITIDETENGTYTDKTGSFEDSANVYLNNDGQFVYTYSYGNTYDANIFVVVPESTADSDEYKLSDNVANGNI